MSYPTPACSCPLDCAGKSRTDSGKSDLTSGKFGTSCLVKPPGLLDKIGADAPQAVDCMPLPSSASTPCIPSSVLPDGDDECMALCPLGSDPCKPDSTVHPLVCTTEEANSVALCSSIPSPCTAPNPVLG
jgi:hypothetical protein